MPSESERISMLEVELAAHKEDYEKQRTIEDERHSKTMTEIAGIVEATAGIVDAWTTANSVQRFIKWLGGFGVLAAAIAWWSGLIDKFIR